MNVTVATHMVALEQLVVKVDHVLWHVQANQMRCVVVAVPTRFIWQIVSFLANYTQNQSENQYCCLNLTQMSSIIILLWKQSCNSI